MRLLDNQIKLFNELQKFIEDIYTGGHSYVAYIEAEEGAGLTTTLNEFKNKYDIPFFEKKIENYKQNRKLRRKIRKGKKGIILDNVKKVNLETFTNFTEDEVKFLIIVNFDKAQIPPPFNIRRSFKLNFPTINEIDMIGNRKNINWKALNDDMVMKDYINLNLLFERC